MTDPAAPQTATTTDEDPLAGTPYRFIARIGEGGMGEVIEAEHMALGSRVAVKLLRAEHFLRFELKDRMRLEAQACARVRHENLVVATDYDETAGGRAFVVMELLEGSTLGDEMRRRGALPVSEAIDIACQTLAGLAAAHAAGLVHRDIKPDNLFLCTPSEGRRRVKVLDFGIAKIVDAGRDPRTPLPLMQPTADGMTVGTPRYASPEQSRGERDIDARSDVYSLGWVLYAMLTGREPFHDRRTQIELWRAHERELPPPPSAAARQPIATELDRIVMKAMAKRREDRFASAEAFRAELLRLDKRPMMATASATAPGPATTARAWKGTAIMEPGVASQTRVDVPAQGPRSAGTPFGGVATVELRPSSAGTLASAGAKTVDLGGAPFTGPSAGGAHDAGVVPRGTIDAVNDAPTRAVTPWANTSAPTAARSRRGLGVPLAVLLVVLVVSSVGIAALRVLGVW